MKPGACPVFLCPDIFGFETLYLDFDIFVILFFLKQISGLFKSYFFMNKYFLIFITYFSQVSNILFL
ncbi:MAG TPA: hypothetical protein DCQ87_02770 [Lachnospiraceae bacterium]|nr:hypothetical protein [Lachnospiraceae bacterium]